MGTPIKISATPGFGSMLAVIRQGAKLPSDVGTQWIRDLVMNWSSGAVAAIDLFKTQKYKNFKTLRDRLSHGQPLPSDEKALLSIKQGLAVLIDTLEKLFFQLLKETTLDVDSGRILIHKKRERERYLKFRLFGRGLKKTGGCLSTRILVCRGFTMSNITAIYGLTEMKRILLSFRRFILVRRQQVKLTLAS
jgi:hypothetical protein